MPLSLRATYLLLAAIILGNFVLWLDSFDRYLSSRYHVALGEILPEAAFVPSRQLLALGGRSGASAGPTDAEVTAVEAATKPEPAPQPMPEPVSPPAPVIAAIPPPAAPAPPPALPRPSETAVPDKDGSPRVLFAGDSMMQGVAPIAIAQIRKIYPDGFYSDQSKQSTGLTVRRYFDWPARIREEVGKHRFDTLVIFLGPNDPWDIVEDGKRHIFPSESWEEKYRARVAEVMTFCQQNRVRLIWIGLPNMRNERTRRGAVVENRIFSEEARRFGFTYLSTEALFGGLDEPFSKHIDDPHKGKLAVRADDGTHFTPAGLRMISARLVEEIHKRDR